jgi:hypothetical protein
MPLNVHLGQGWPDEFVTKAIENVAQTFFGKIKTELITKKKVAQNLRLLFVIFYKMLK